MDTAGPGDSDRCFWSWCSSAEDRLQTSSIWRSSGRKRTFPQPAVLLALVRESRVTTAVAVGDRLGVGPAGPADKQSREEQGGDRQGREEEEDEERDG